MVTIAVIHFTNYPKGQNRACMHAVMRYAQREEKTRMANGVRLISGVNCRPESAYSDFLNTKLLHHKEDGVLFFHMVQSFPKGEHVDPKTAHAAALKLAAAFGDREVLVCTHLDREHIHSHLIINSVGFQDGKKLHISQPELVELRRQNDAICQEFGLPVFQKQGQKKTSSMSGAEYHAAAKGESWKLRLMNVIDDCMQYAADREQFIQLMQSEGYAVKWTDSRKYITYTTREGQPCRDNKLHEEKYLKEAMEHEFAIRQALIAGRIEAAEPAATHTIFVDQRGSGGHDEHDLGYGRPTAGDADRPGTAPQTGQSIANSTDFGAAIGNAKGTFVGAETGWEAERAVYLSAAYQVQDAADQPGLAPADTDFGGLVGDVVKLGYNLEQLAEPALVMDSTTMPHHIDSKDRCHIREKKLAMGQKDDDTEQSQGWQQTMY